MRELQVEKEKQEEDDKKAEDEYLAQAKAKGMLPDQDDSKSDGEKSVDEDDPQKLWDDYLAEHIEFSDEEDLQALG